MSAVPKLRSLPDRIRQIALFEVGGLVLITPPFVWLSGQPALPSLGLLAVLALIAAVWNGLFNTAFDWLEGRLTGRPADRRPWRLRAVHAALFEGGLLLLTLPVIVLWTGLGWWPAFITDLGLAAAYVAYAFVFNIAYDRLFPITAPNPDPRSPRMPTTTLVITGMQTDECLRSVMNAIQDLPCIGYVDVSLATGEATIEHTPMVSEGDIRAAIEGAGFPTK